VYQPCASLIGLADNIEVCSIPVVFKDLVPEYSLAPQGKPRVQAFDRLFHFQAGMQAQILRKDLRSMHGVFLRIAFGCDHEQAISVYTWRTEP